MRLRAQVVRVRSVVSSTSASAEPLAGCAGHTAEESLAGGSSGMVALKLCWQEGALQAFVIASRLTTVLVVVPALAVDVAVLLVPVAMLATILRVVSWLAAVVLLLILRHEATAAVSLTWLKVLGRGLEGRDIGLEAFRLGVIAHVHLLPRLPRKAVVLCGRVFFPRVQFRHGLRKPVQSGCWDSTMKIRFEVVGGLPDEQLGGNEVSRRRINNLGFRDTLMTQGSRVEQILHQTLSPARGPGPRGIGRGCARQPGPRV